MIINKMLKSYTDIPLWILWLIAPFYYLIPEKIRYGGIYRKTREYLKYTERLPEEEIEKLKNEKLCEVITHAYRTVPYYKEVFDKLNIRPSDIKEESDLVKLPFLSKELLRKNQEALIADDMDIKKLHWITTSGSTGNPVGFYIDENNPMQEWAYGTYLYERNGWTSDCSKVMLRGKGFYNKEHKKKSWQYDPFKRELSCDIFNMTDQNNEEYCKAIEKYKPDNLYGYMSAIVILCKHIEKRPGGIHHQFRGIYACSENIIPVQREYVQRILHARVFSNYGHSERLILAGECEYSNEYHIEPLYGIAELVDKEGNVITEPGIVGELVGTGFCNQGMPLIRYRTGDMAVWSGIQKCPCGRMHKRLEKIEGRWKQDVLVNKQGALVTLTALNMHSDVFDLLERYQFIQDTIGVVDFHLKPLEALTQADIDKILTELQKKVDYQIEFNIRIVDDIPVMKNGKYKIIDQRLQIESFASH